MAEIISEKAMSAEKMKIERQLAIGNRKHQRICISGGVHSWHSSIISLKASMKAVAYESENRGGMKIEARRK
jgi:hypothetical protein